MKKQLVSQVALLAVFFTACVKEPGQTPGQSDVVNLSAIEPMADFAVPVRSGMASIVTLGEDTLAVTDEAVRIPVPRSALSANRIVVSYSDEDIFRNFASFKYWQYISFEDTRSADYDYNDLVIHCMVKTDRIPKSGGGYQYKHLVAVQPVALGSSKNLGLGIMYRSDLGASALSEAVLSDNVRARLFDGNPVFPINTDPGKERKKVSSQLTELFTLVNSDTVFRVVWFIDADGEGRLYAATTNFGADRTFDMVSKDGLPFGMSMTQKWNYPIEKCHIRNAYAGFDQWLKDGNENTLLNSGRTQANLFPASMPKNMGLDDLWDYDMENPIKK